MVVANKQNLKKYAKALLGNEYSPHRELMLLNSSNLGQFNVALKGFGVEGCYCKKKPELSFEYINMGDSYTLTILMFKNKLRIGTWAEIVEKNMRYFE